ncbi:unnamed protein product [Boreogadus saida]
MNGRPLRASPTAVLQRHAGKSLTAVSDFCVNFLAELESTDLCNDAAAHKFDRKLTELQYRGALQKWLRYAPERSGGVPRKGKD